MSYPWIAATTIVANAFLSLTVFGAPVAPRAESTPAVNDSIAVARAAMLEGRYEEADLLATRLLHRAATTPGLDSLRLATYMDVALDALGLDGKTDLPETRQLAARALRIRESRLGPEDLDVASSLIRSARGLNADEKELVLATQRIERAVRIREGVLGPEHLDVAQALYALGMTWRGRFEFAKARPCFERALSIRERSLGPHHRDVAESLYGLANVIHESGDFEHALPLRLRSLAIWEAALGPRHPEVARGLNALGNLYRNMGEYTKARPVLERGLAIREAALRPDHPDIAASLNNLANCLHETGDYAAALPLRERVLTLWMRAFGDESSGAGKALLNLANLQADMGEYTRARRTYDRTIVILERVHGPNHELTGVAVDALADLLHLLGDFENERPLRERALAIFERAQGPNGLMTGRALRGLANLERDTGEPDQAAKHYERARQVLVSGGYRTELAQLRVDIGRSLALRGDVAGAKASYRAALVAIEEFVGSASPGLLQCLTELGDVFRTTGDADSARTLYERALANGERSLGPDHPQLAPVLEGLAAADQALGRWSEAMDCALRAERIGRDQLRLTARALPESQALRFASVRTSGLDLALSMMDRMSEPSPNARVLDAWIRSRAVVLDEVARRHHPVDQDTGAVRLEAAYASASTRYANLVVRGPDLDHPERYRPQLDEARRERDEWQRRLAEWSASYRSIEARDHIGIAEVQTSLQKGDALVSFVRFHSLGQTTPSSTERLRTPDGAKSKDSTLYLAFVLTKGSSTPDAVTLGTARTIDSLAAAWGDTLALGALTSVASSNAEASCRRAGEVLRRAIWDPLGPLLGEATRVFLVPDGAIHLINFAALPVGPTQYLVEAGPLIHYLSAERDLATHRPSKAPTSRLLAVGGPNYDASVGSQSAAKSPADSRRRSSASGAVNQVYRGPRVDCGDFRSQRFSALPGSLQEAREIRRLWDAARGESSSVELTGADASESTLKRSVAGSSILHLATHAFFIDSACGPSGADDRGIGGVRYDRTASIPRTAIENPLLLSGLALAGANRRAAAGPNDDDGILTAEEIAALDLSSVQWAVLSGCRTAVGQVRAGEGVFGLRRAFEVAGARTLIMSLWSVGDQSTRQWMEALYRARLERGLATAEAVREASRTLLAARRSRGLDTHPFHWAGFVAVGDWK